MAAANLGLPATAGTSVAQGSYLNAATAKEPVAVLGAEAAQLMGIDRIWPGERIWVGGQWFYLVGILHPVTLAPQIDTSILAGSPAAQTYLGFDGHPSSSQFLAEAILLALAAAAAGDIAGGAATAIYAHAKRWAIVIPPDAWPAASAPPSSSAPSPGSCPPSAPPACHPRKRSGPCEHSRRGYSALAAGNPPCADFRTRRVAS